MGATITVLHWIGIGLALADLVTTLIGTRLAGSEGEDNPPWRAVIARFGPVVFAVAYIGLSLGLLAAASWLGQEALAAWCAVLAIILANNLRELGKLVVSPDVV